MQYENLKEMKSKLVNFEEELGARKKEIYQLKKKYISVMDKISYIGFEYDIDLDRVKIYESSKVKCDAIHEIYNVKTSNFENKILHRDFKKVYKETINSIIEGENFAACNIKIFHTTNRYEWYRLSLEAEKKEDGSIQKIVGYLRDISNEKEMEFAFQKEEKYKIAMLSDAIAYYDINLTRDKIDDYTGELAIKYDNLDQYTYTYWLNKILETVIYNDDKEMYEKTFSRKALIEKNAQGITDFKHTYRRLNSENVMRWVTETAHLIKDIRNDNLIFFGYIKDIHEEKLRSIKLQYNSQHDALTKLYNRGFTSSRIDIILSESAASEEHSLIILDIDNFKSINDSYGHAFGDSILISLANKLKNNFLGKDIVGRLGGDEFIVFIKDTNDINLLKGVCNNLCGKTHSDVDTKEMYSCSIGVSRYPLDGITFDELYKAADIALYATKERGGSGFTLYEEKLKEEKWQPSIITDIDEGQCGAEEKLELIDHNNRLEMDVLKKDILDNLQEAIYVADDDTDELLFLSENIKKYFGINNDEEYLGRKCYEFLRGADSPCVTCIQLKESSKKDIIRKEFIKSIGKHLVTKSKRTVLNGKNVRLQIGIDITEQEEKNIELIEKLKTVKCLMDCVKWLSTSKNLFEVSREVLQEIKTFFDAQMVYFDQVFQEINNYHTLYKIADSNACEFSDAIKKTRSSNATLWDSAFDFGEPIVFDNTLIINRKKHPKTTELLDNHGILYFYEIPINVDNERYGVIGIVNPHKNLDKIGVLKELKYFINNELTKRRAYNKIQYLSFYDGTTGLKNVNSYTNFLAADNYKDVNSLAIIVSDINGLKIANDKYGHEYGDQIVKNTANVLKKHFKTDNIFRLTGDEFTIICEDNTREEFERKIEDLKKDLQDIDGDGLSIGYAWEDVEIDALSIIKKADELLQIEKQRYYEHRSIYGSRGNLKLLYKLQKDIDSGMYQMFLQPKFNINTGIICGAEALARYRTVENVYTLPSRFIPTLEKDNLIKYLDFYIFEQVCKLISKWKKEDIVSVPLSFNFSRVTLMDPDVVDSVTSILDKYDILPQLLQLEITETVGELDLFFVNQILKKFKDKGIHIHLDDFGTKYSSLSVLTILQLDEVKIDRSLLVDIVKSRKSRIVIKSVIDMCNALNISVIAEGVDDSQQIGILSRMGCHKFQGYFYDKALSLEEFEGKYMMKGRKRV